MIIPTNDAGLPHGILDVMYEDLEWDLKMSAARQIVDLVSSKDAPPRFLSGLVTARFEDLYWLCEMSHLAWARSQPDVVAFADKGKDYYAQLSKALLTLSMADACTFIYAVEKNKGGDENPTDIKSWAFLDSRFCEKEFGAIRETFLDGLQICSKSVLDSLFDVESALAENLRKTVWDLVYPDRPTKKEGIVGKFH